MLVLLFLTQNGQTRFQFDEIFVPLFFCGGGPWGGSMCNEDLPASKGCAGLMFPEQKIETQLDKCKYSRKKERISGPYRRQT
jgi:hypothetical protein